MALPHASKRIWVDEVRSGSSYNSSSDLRLHFRLGQETHPTGLTVRLPNGARKIAAVAAVDRFTEVMEGKHHPEPEP